MDKTLIDKEYSDGIKGWMCVAVLLHHLALFSGIFANTYFGHFLNLLGSWAVAVFLFLSGYGLYVSYSAKGDSYIRGFLKKRFLPLYISYLIAVMIYFIYDYLIPFIKNTSAVSVKEALIKLLKSLTWGETVVSFGWFFQMLFVAYLLFFFVFRFCKKPFIRSLILGIVFLIYLLFAHCFGQYDVPIISFACGMIAAVHRNRLSRFFEKYMIVLTILFFCIFFTVYMLYVQGTIMGKFAMNYVTWSALSAVSDIAIIGFVISVSTIFKKYKIPVIVNPVTSLIKTYSFEIYVLQGLFLRLLNPMIENRYMYSAVSFFCIIAASLLLNLLITLVKKPFTKTA